MLCPKCDAHMPDGAEFCIICGKRLAESRRLEGRAARTKSRWFFTAEQETPRNLWDAESRDAPVEHFYDSHETAEAPPQPNTPAGQDFAFNAPNASSHTASSSYGNTTQQELLEAIRRRVEMEEATDIDDSENAHEQQPHILDTPYGADSASADSNAVNTTYHTGEDPDEDETPDSSSPYAPNQSRPRYDAQEESLWEKQAQHASQDSNSYPDPANRLFAFGFDALLIGILTYFIMPYARTVYWEMGLYDWETASILLFLVIGVFYFTLLESSGIEGSPGKAAMGLRVVTLEGESLSRLRAFFRQIGKLICWGTFGLGFLLARSTPRSQGLHDLLTGTVVVRKSSQ